MADNFRKLLPLKKHCRWFNSGILELCEHVEHVIQSVYRTIGYCRAFVTLTWNIVEGILRSFKEFILYAEHILRSVILLFAFLQ